MRRWLPLLLVILGVMVMGAGFMYDVLFAGIPYQDPTPELSAQYAFHAQVASIIGWVGLGIGLVGLVGGATMILRAMILRRR